MSGAFPPEYHITSEHWHCVPPFLPFIAFGGEGGGGGAWGPAFAWQPGSLVFPRVVCLFFVGNWL